MPDEPEYKEEDPVTAIRGALTKALGTLKKLLVKEEEMQEEMQEVEEDSDGEERTTKGTQVTNTRLPSVKDKNDSGDKS